MRMVVPHATLLDMTRGGEQRTYRPLTRFGFPLPRRALRVGRWRIAVSVWARRKRSVVPPLVCLTPFALRSVITRISLKESSRLAETVECSRLAFVMSLISFVVICAAVCMSLSALACSRTALAA